MTNREGNRIVRYGKSLIILCVFCLVSCGKLGASDWEFVSQEEFESKVINSEVPVLVKFDTAENCHGGDDALTQLARRYAGRVFVARVPISKSPRLAQTYAINGPVVFALFKDGREIKRIDAPVLLEKVSARGGGYFIDENYILELENFIGPL